MVTGQTNATPPPPAPRSPRLTLHIPNSYPRVMSPRTSPRSPSSLSPLPALNGGHGNDASHVCDMERDTDSLIARRASHVSMHAMTDFFKARKTSAESARDFLARERTFFSWLRLSSTMAIGSAALFLRLRIKDLSDVLKRHDGDTGKRSQSQKLSVRWERALQRRAQRMRNRQQRQQPFLAQTDNVDSVGFPVTVEKVLATASLSAPPTSTSSPLGLSNAPSLSTEGDVLDTNIVLSQALGGVFFALAIVSLAVGYVDYMVCVRALEFADVVVPVAEEYTGDDVHPATIERRAAVVRWHDARHATRAHSSKMVFLTELTVAAVVFATALTIIITSDQASVAPPIPPTHILRL